ncbi:MAG: thrombospondin type 3 repeat-containing protein [Actinomycetia bacterium]|nr:thrombospondin type 3 repeat-containing protein [Actinomycetes bacterium]
MTSGLGAENFNIKTETSGQYQGARRPNGPTFHFRVESTESTQGFRLDMTSAGDQPDVMPTSTTETVCDITASPICSNREYQSAGGWYWDTPISSLGDPLHSWSVDGSRVQNLSSGNHTEVNTLTWHLTRLPDQDVDGVPDADDDCPGTFDPEQLCIDTDGDGFDDVDDNCTFLFNDQANSDNDPYGDACDSDDDNDGLTDEYELSIATDPTNVDSDGDGLSDGTEVNGVPPSDPNDPNDPPRAGCVSGADYRFTGATVRAELDLLGPFDPDFFEFSTTMKWCVVNGLVYADGAPSNLSLVTMNTFLATGLDLLGFTWEPGPDPNPPGVSGQGTPTMTVTSQGLFKACFNVIDGAALVGGGLIKGGGAAVKKFGPTVMSKFLSSTRAGRSFSQAVDDAVFSGIAKADALMASASRKVDSLVRRAKRLLPDSLVDGLKDVLEVALLAAVEAVHAAVSTVVRSVIERNGPLLAASKRLRSQATDQIETELGAAIGNIFGVEIPSWDWCYDAWEPVMQMTLSAANSSSVTVDGFTPPYFVVSGGIDFDRR